MTYIDEFVAKFIADVQSLWRGVRLLIHPGHVISRESRLAHERVIYFPVFGRWVERRQLWDRWAFVGFADFADDVQRLCVRASHA